MSDTEETGVLKSRNESHDEKHAPEKRYHELKHTRQIGEPPLSLQL